MDEKAAKTKRRWRPLAVRLAEKRLEHEAVLRKDFEALMAARKDKPNEVDIEKRVRALTALRKALAEAYPLPKARSEVEMDDRYEDGGDLGKEPAAVDAVRARFEHKFSRYLASRDGALVAQPARRGDGCEDADGVEHLGPG